MINVKNSFKINGKTIGPDEPPYCIAEVGINHNGSLKLAKEMIEVAKDSGADAVKFQTFKAEEFCGDPKQMFTYKSQGKVITESMLDMFKRYEFPKSHWKEIKDYSDKVGITFFSTPQNKSDLEMLIKIGKFYLHLGSARLSLRGDSSENMPMIGKDGNIIVYNGEVFDLKSLKQKLNNNKEYTGDTRMLLDLLSNNEKDINEVNGMFAFAFYSNKFKKLFLGRDKLGIKPLHFVKKNNQEIFFSSEMSSLINFSNTELNLKTT